MAALLAEMLLAQGRDILGDDNIADRNYQMAALTVVNGLIELGATWWRGELEATAASCLAARADEQAAHLAAARRAMSEAAAALRPYHMAP